MRLGVAYYGSYLPWHLKQDLEDIKHCGCDDVLITLQENDFKVFNGKLRFAAKLAHDIGLKAIANFWGYARMLGGGRMSHLLVENLDAWQVNRDGRKIGAGCMNNPYVFNFLVKMVEDIASFDYDGIFIDEPTKTDCYCKYCKEKFRSEFDSSLFKASQTEIEEFRSKSVIDFLRKICEAVKDIDKNLETSTCIMPKDKDLWKDAVKIKSLDYFGTDPYWLLWNQPLSFVTESTKLVVQLCRRYNKKSLMWILCWKVPDGKEKEIYEAALLCAKERPDAIYTWSYKGGLGTYEESDNPHKAWLNIVNAYRDIRKNFSFRSEHE